MIIYCLNKKEIEEICHQIAVIFLNSNNEPISPFEDRNDALLESALANPNQTFAGNQLYSNLIEKGAILFYGMIKNHPFKNGNKRIASVTLYVFIWINGFRIVSEDPTLELANLALKVSNSKSDQKDKILIEIINWLEINILEQVGGNKGKNIFETRFFSDKQ